MKNADFNDRRSCMAIILELKIVPQSGRQAFVRDKSGAIKCFLKSPPVDGKANEELIKVLSKRLAITQESIKILQGVTSRKKILKIDTTLTLPAILQTLGVETQQTL
jgi:uncharacterized protein (TIGR00251 family)